MTVLIAVIAIIALYVVYLRATAPPNERRIQKIRDRTYRQYRRGGCEEAYARYFAYGDPLPKKTLSPREIPVGASDNWHAKSPYHDAIYGAPSQEE